MYLISPGEHIAICNFVAAAIVSQLGKHKGDHCGKEQRAKQLDEDAKANQHADGLTLRSSKTLKKTCPNTISLND